MPVRAKVCQHPLSGENAPIAFRCLTFIELTVCFYNASKYVLFKSHVTTTAVCATSFVTSQWAPDAKVEQRCFK